MINPPILSIMPEIDNVRFVKESVWLSFNQMAELFQRDKSVMSRHISHVFEEGELLQKLQQLPLIEKPIR